MRFDVLILHDEKLRALVPRDAKFRVLVPRVERLHVLVHRGARLRALVLRDASFIIKNSFLKEIFNYTMETCMLLAEVGVHEPWGPQ